MLDWRFSKEHERCRGREFPDRACPWQ